MKIATSLTRLFSLFCVLTLVSPQLFAVDNYKEFRRDQWDIDLGTSYFLSNANHTKFGNRDSLASGRQFQLLDVYMSTRYMPQKNRAYYAWGNIGNSESKDGNFVRTNSTFTEAGAGLDFIMFSGVFDLIPSVAFVAPLQKIDPTGDIAASGEGVMEVHSRLLFQKDFGTWMGYSWLGFNFRSEGRSFLMPWGVGAQLQGSAMKWGAEIFGFNSVSDDTNNNATRDNYINTVQAGSMKFYSRNPALIDSQAYGLWKINSKWSIQANGGLTLAGSNTAAGFHVGGFLRYTFDLTDGYRQPVEAPVYYESPVPAKKSQMYTDPMSSEREVRKFKENTKDGVDQNLFRVRNKRVQPKGPSLQKQLDKTEFQIELRRKKKGE